MLLKSQAHSPRTVFRADSSDKGRHSPVKCGECWRQNSRGQAELKLSKRFQFIRYFFVQNYAGFVVDLLCGCGCRTYKVCEA